MLNMLDTLPDDPLLQIIADFRSDSRSEKMDLGVGVYKDANGQTPVMDAVKQAEAILLDTQDSKSYLGLAGDEAYLDELAKLTFTGDMLAHGIQGKSRLTGIQTPGASAALRLASDLIVLMNPDASILVGEPSWSNHIPIFRAAALGALTYPYYDQATGSLDLDSMLAACSAAAHGTVVLLQGCCHNPTGVDLCVSDWSHIADICNSNGLLPLIDIAYNGLGSGFDQDMAGVNALLACVPEALIAVSCSKSFGLYRERTGALYALAADADTARKTRGNLFALARTSYSMPPDHGAAIVRTILQNPALRALWLKELGDMRARIDSIRRSLSEALTARGVVVSGLATDKGMFSLLPLSRNDIDTLRHEDGIYMSEDGRINVASMQAADVDRFAAAIERVLSTNRQAPTLMQSSSPPL